jgi:uncharacterized membrane protein YgdD (TMEM256/DUF423 family)
MIQDTVTNEDNVSMTDKALTVLAALNMFIAVGAGAFGAHGLKRVLSTDMLAVWQTAVTYQLVHALGIFAIVLLGARAGSPVLSSAGWVMFAGIVLFSGSLYVLSLTGIRWLGPITPLGGLAFLVAWAMVAWSAWRNFA